MPQSFDLEEALKGLRAGKDLTGKDGVLMPLIKQLTEAAITGELEHHIATNSGDSSLISWLWTRFLFLERFTG